MSDLFSAEQVALMIQGKLVPTPELILKGLEVQNSRVQQEFARSLALWLQHMVNNDLAIIQGSAHMAGVRMSAGEDYESYLQQIEETCQRISQIFVLVIRATGWEFYYEFGIKMTKPV